MYVFIASHITPYRLTTLPQAIQSVIDAIKKAQSFNILPQINNIFSIYISYSYEDAICIEKINKLETMIKEYIITNSKNISINFYRHSYRLLQFEHFRNIIYNEQNKNSFKLNDWIMFQDDDDLSLDDRIITFLRQLYKNYNMISFVSEMYRFERLMVIPKMPYSNKDNYKDNQMIYKCPADFATTFVQVKNLKTFLESNTHWDNYTDCSFKAYLQSLGNQFYHRELLYVVRMRSFSTDEEYLEKIKEIEEISSHN